MDKDPISETLNAELSVHDLEPHEIDVFHSGIDAKSNLVDLMIRGTDLLEDASKLAKELESPRAYEVASNMLKNVAELNLKIIEMEQQKDAPEKASYQQNNFFVGTTEELQKMIQQQRKES